MMTHVALIGSDPAVAEVHAPAAGDPTGEPLVVLTFGPPAGIVLHMSVETATSIADALVDAVAEAEAVFTVPTGPRAYIPGWHPV